MHRVVLLKNQMLSVAMLLMGLALFGCNAPPQNAGSVKSAPSKIETVSTPRPNILVIIADDLGYSDIGAFGSEIATPNLDNLAAAGLVLSNFHTHTMCTPTRAMLLSGANNHAVGIATMAAEQRGAQKGAPGYEAYLRPNVTIIAELLRDSGYRTYITGKWDLGGRKDPALQPQNRGFDKSFILVEGSADHFRNFPALAELPDVNYRYNGAVVEQLPQDFYSTTAFTDYMLEFLAQHDGDGSDVSDNSDDRGNSAARPFFAYLAYTAPHYPLQAPDPAIARYQGRYDQGYDAIAAARLERMKRNGIISSEIEPAPGHPAWPAWNELDDKQKAFEVRRMEVYAAMIDEMDRGIGRVIEQLRASGQLHNTLIVFMSDNGPEGGNPLDWADYYSEWATGNFDLSLQNLGRPHSFAWTGPGWAQVSSTPFSLYKGFASEGGTRVPAIVHWPQGLQRKGVNDSFAHVLDLPATFLDYANVSHSGNKTSGFHDRTLEGSSMRAFMQAQADTVHPPDKAYVWEMLDRRAVRKGDWKITWANQPWGKGLGQWSLYNIANDPAEQHDLSAERPNKVKELLVHWRDYVANNGLILVPDGIDMLWTNLFTHYQWSPVPQAAK